MYEFIILYPTKTTMTTGPSTGYKILILNDYYKVRLNEARTSSTIHYNIQIWFTAISNTKYKKSRLHKTSICINNYSQSVSRLNRVLENTRLLKSEQRFLTGDCRERG